MGLFFKNKSKKRQQDRESIKDKLEGQFDKFGYLQHYFVNKWSKKLNLEEKEKEGKWYAKPFKDWFKSKEKT